MIIIPEIIGDIVTSTATELGITIDYYYGVDKEINARLVARNGTRGKKNPAIFLFLDLEENRNGENIWAEISPEIAIVTKTNINLTASQRLDKSFKPTLYPIYEEFIKQITLNSNVASPFVDHIKKDRFFYGSTLNTGKKDAFSDRLDAISLSIRGLVISLNTCGGIPA